MKNAFLLDDVIRFILFQRVEGHHAIAVVAKEDFVDNGVGAYLQLCQGIVGQVPFLRLQRGAVAAYVDGTADDGRMVFVLTSHNDGHLLGIGAHIKQTFDGSIF